MNKLYLLFFTTIFMSSCTYGPKQNRGMLDSARRVAETKTFIATTRHTVYQEATGINSFPNGGVSLISKQTLRVYLLNGDTGSINKLLEIEAPKKLKTSFRSAILGFRDNNIYIQLNGCHGSECYPKLTNYTYYRVALDGSGHSEQSRPADKITNPPTMLSRSPNERVYYRISTGYNQISHRFNENDEFQNAFIVDNQGILKNAKHDR